MTWFSGSLSFAIIWWVVLFAVLPFGVKTADEAGIEPEPGQATSAPVKPRMALKLAATTVITAVLFVGVWAVVEYDPFGLADYILGR